MSHRIAVVGLGVMGRNHARVLAELEGAELAALVDPAPSAEIFARRRFQAPLYQDLEQMLARESPSAAVVAVPTTAHYGVARRLLESGVHVLVEKPLAATSTQAAELVALAEHRRVALAVGHIERFNPAVEMLRQRLAAGELGQIFEVAARRRTPFPPRVMDCGVTIDLATHDIDLMRYLLGSDPIQVYARTARRIHSAHEDSLIALLTFADETIGLLEADWLTPRKIRTLEVTGERGMFVVEHLSQELTLYENGAPIEGWSSLDDLIGIVEGDMRRFAIARAEPLARELTAFLAFLDGKDSPLATGRDGVAAVRIAEDLLRAADKNAELPRGTGVAG